jgi:hypothetical protein
MNWQPIEKYYKYKKKPDNCIFYYPEVKHGSRAYLNLSEMILTTCIYGDRLPTHFFKVGTPND